MTKTNTQQTNDTNIKLNQPEQKSPLEFQITDWNTYHEIDGEDEEVYNIQLFGRTMDDKDVCLKVTGFTPFFYVEVPLNWGTKQVDRFVDILKSRVKYRTENNPNYNYDLSKSLVRYRLVQKHKFYNFTNKKNFNFVMLVFKSHIGMREFAMTLARPLKCNGLAKDPILFQRYESNIEPHIRFMHINNLSSCGWVTIDHSHLKEIPEYSHCDLSYKVDWKYVKPSSNENRMAPLKIMGYDIECISCDHNFPQAKRKTDKAIQIGCTLYRYGSMKCYEEHLLTMKSCVKIPNVNVQCFKTEKGLLRAFAKLIQTVRPDIIAGYNNFGFDDKYICDRINRIDAEAAEKLGVSIDNLENKFCDEILTIMGKVNNEYLIKTEQIDVTMKNFFGTNYNNDDQNNGRYCCPSLTYFEVKNLSSSALGDNELKFFKIPGIINIDMMKVIQRDHRLIGYKLDNVSANFITEKGEKFVEGKRNSDGTINLDIYTKSTKALEPDSYIQIMVDDSYSSSPLIENAKYKVRDITTITDKKGDTEVTYQCIKTSINECDVKELREAIVNPLLKIFWTFAKDDMHHTLINKYFKEGDPKRIAQIGKYCLKDCKLVNLLLAKLETIISSIGMAKVCHVPLSYLFLRGQGVKIFSLVSKKCRSENFLIPVLRKKKNDANGDDDESYEGATVITPKPLVYFSPIGVLDYSSLYPNSMRERNLTPECYLPPEFVGDPKYDNLEGYRYHDIYITMKDKKGRIIRNLDGSAQKKHNRFAQKLDENGEPIYGILPAILTELLDQRKATNKKLGEEKDPFVRSILNSLQLAYKITANSLYGQTGSSFSPIFFMQVAESTTSVGRERLFYAQKMVEEHFPGSEVIYGDSVTGDTPVILRNDHNHISIKTIEKLGQEWKPYDQSKEQSNVDANYQVWTANGWANIKRVIRHKTTKKIYRVLTRIGCVDVTEDHSLIDGNKNLIKPTECEIGTELLHKWIDTDNENSVKGYDLVKLAFKHIKSIPLRKLFFYKQIYLTTDKSNAQRMYCLIKRFNYKVEIDFIKIGSKGFYKLDFSKDIQTNQRNPNQIKSVQFLRNTNADEFVYDLETDTDTFQAGIGELIVKNTDSIFINFHLKNPDGSERTDVSALLETIELSQQAAKLINDVLPKPQCIVYEKTLHPFILIAKKKYVGYLFEKDPNKFFLKSMGIVLKRRDNAPIVKIVVGGIIDHILKNRDVEKAIDYVRNVLNKLMLGGYPMDKFVISKTLKARYKKPSSIAHAVLANRVSQRDYGNRFQINDRVPYVYVVKDFGRKKKKDILQGDLIETPEFVTQNNLKIDYLYYLEHQIINPATQILELLVPTRRVNKLFNEFIIEEQNKRNHRQSMEKWQQSETVNDPDSWEPILMD